MQRASVQTARNRSAARPGAMAALATVLAWCLAFPAAAVAEGGTENLQHTKNTPDLGLRSDLKIDPSTLAMSIQIPLGNYPGRAGMDTPVGLHYSSKVWRIEYDEFVTGTLPGCGEDVNEPVGPDCYTATKARYAEKSVSGWTFVGLLPTIEYSSDERFDLDGRPCCNNTEQGRYIPRMTVRFSDGSTHELRRGDTPLPGGDSKTGDYYSVDASRMKFVGTAPGTGKLYMPDGSRYDFANHAATQYIDRNGNVRVGQEDTLGRSIPQPVFHNGFADTETRSLPGVGGASMDYTFDLRQLGSPGVLERRMDNTMPVLHHDGDRDKFGNGSHSPSLFHSDDGDNRVVQQGLFNPVVLHRIVLPDGSAYTFTYNEYGEIAKVVYPTGGYERYRYAEVGSLSPMTVPYAQANRGVVERRVSASGDGGDEVTWLYGTTQGSLAPDGTRTVRKLHAASPSGTVLFGFDDPRAGMAYDERIYALESEDSMLRRTLTKWGFSGPLPNGHISAKRDPKVLKKVELLLDTGTGNALAKTTTFEYGQASQPLNVTAVTEHAYVEVPRAVAKDGTIDDIPAGAALRTTETVYKEDDAYNDQNLVALPISTTIRAGGSGSSPSPGPVVARTEIYYDEKNYSGTDLSLLPCGATKGREAATTPEARGNVTTVGRWLDTLGLVNSPPAYLDSHTRYDGCGSVRKTWQAAARGTVSTRVSEVEYSSEYQFAYPTRTISPVPDAAGANGSNAPLETTTVYDFHTGLVLSTTDANGQTTSYSYADPDTGVVDPLGRLRRVTQPDGGSTKFDFGGAAGNRFVRVRTAIDASRSTDSYQFFDGLGRPSRAYSFDGSAPERTWVATKTQRYEETRQVKVSSPHFRSDLNDFDLDSPSNTVPVSISTSDPLGRVTSVLSPDGATAATEYKGAEVTVTDQTQRKRSSVADALGRLEKVIEAPGVSGYGYETTYEYDALGNLEKVAQGKAGQARQTRSFGYDSLSRLTSATNPESGTVTYEYDVAGNLTKKVDARHVQTDYRYDALNRVVGRSYSVEAGHPAPAGFAATPAVSYFYDGTGMPAGGGSPQPTPLPTPDHSAGRLTAVKSSMSETIYTEFDVLGRVQRHLQVVEPNTNNERTYQMAYEYDLMGNLRSQTYPSGKVVETEYDGAGRVAGVKNRADGKYYAGSADAAGRIEYAAHGAVSAVKLGNGLWEHTNFNTRLQPTEIGLGATKDDPTTNGSVLRLEYAYEGPNAANNPEDRNNGNVRSQRIVAPGLDLTQSYGYDHLNRLERARELKAGAEQWKQVYKYDQFGNRRFDSGTTLPALPGSLADKVNNPEADTATNRLKEHQDVDTTKDYEYDAAGNLTLDARGRTFAYDANNMQVTFNGGPDPNTNGASYAYDGDGRRVRKVTAWGTTLFVYDAMGSLVAEYSTEAPQPGSGGVKYLTADNLGTPRVITDKGGRVVSRHDYQPFGEELAVGVGGRANGTGPGQEYVFGVGDDGVRQQFTGQERDRESGLDYFNARYYSSQHGRFTSTDPLAESAKSGNPQSWNRYAYVFNNPLKFVDPTGMAADDPAQQTAQQPMPQPTPAPPVAPVDPVTVTPFTVKLYSQTFNGGQQTYSYGPISMFMTGQRTYTVGTPQLVNSVDASTAANAVAGHFANPMASDILNTMIVVDSIESHPNTAQTQTVTTELGLSTSNGGLTAGRSVTTTVETADKAMSNLHTAMGRNSVNMGKAFDGVSSPVAGHSGSQTLSQVTVNPGGRTWSSEFGSITRRVAFQQAAREFTSATGRPVPQSFLRKYKFEMPNK